MPHGTRLDADQSDAAKGTTDPIRRPAERLTGRVRGDLWVFLAGTGPRVGEVKRLTVADVRLDAVPPHVRIPAAVAKSRREQTVPTRSDLVVLLRERLAGLASSEPVFPIPCDLIARFNADCRRAGIPNRDGEGLTVDVHSLRKTFATMLSRSGVSPRIAMELMRHSQIGLTMKVYTDPRLLPLAAAVESTTPSVVAKVVATGGTPGHFATLDGRPDHQSEAASTVA
jgi:integrase